MEFDSRRVDHYPFSDKQLCHTETLAKNGLESIRAINPKGTLASELWAAERLVQTLGCKDDDDYYYYSAKSIKLPNVGRRLVDRRLQEGTKSKICLYLSGIITQVTALLSPGAATQVPSCTFLIPAPARVYSTRLTS